MLELRNIAKHYGETAVLRDISATIASGERVGIAGRNGAGKTTLVKVLSRSVRADAGSATLRGVDLLRQDMTELRALGVSHVTQRPRLVRSLSVAENVRVAGYFLSQGRGRTLLPSGGFNPDVVAALKTVGASSLAALGVHSLTSFQTRLVELARALFPLPTLLLLDEPAAGLTPDEKHHFIAVLRSPLLTETTMLVIEHDQQFLNAICNRVLRLSNGVFESVGTV